MTVVTATHGLDRPVTLNDVASHAGVSSATVSRVLAGNYPVKAATRQRVLRAVRELNYVANMHARALAGVKTETVAFFLTDVRGPAFSEAAYGVEQEAARRGKLCLLGCTHEDPERELAFVQLMREQQAAAVILIGGIIDDDSYRMRMTEIAHSLHGAGSRLVLCGRPPLGGDAPAIVVEYDNEAGAYAATSHLLSHGHRRILHLTGPVGHTTATGRLDGYRRALSDFGVPVDPALIEHGLFSRESGYEMARRRLAGSTGGSAPDFTAVFAGTDSMAAGILGAIEEAGLRVPRDLSLVGYDDIELASDLRPRLTTVHVPYEELGRTAVRMALDGGRGPEGWPAQRAVLGTHVVVRDSVGRPASR